MALAYYILRAAAQVLSNTALDLRIQTVPLRPYRFPDDYQVVNDLLPQFYTYPDHPEWNLRPDELDNDADFSNGERQLMPLIRIASLFSRMVRDAYCGFVWEEDGKIVGSINYSRMDMLGSFWCWNIGVLPPFQHLDVADRLVQAGIKDVKERGARIIVADVLSQNKPALWLARRHGLKRFTTQAQLFHDSPTLTEIPALPAGCEIRRRSRWDWRSSFDLAKRITPKEVSTYLPVEKARFRQPVFISFLMSIAQRIMGGRYFAFAITQNDSVIAVMSCTTRTSPGGFNEIDISLDPDHAHLARSVIAMMTEKAKGRPIRFVVQSWQPYLMDAALELGFVKKREWVKLGLLLDNA